MKKIKKKTNSDDDMSKGEDSDGSDMNFTGFSKAIALFENYYIFFVKYFYF